MCSFNNATNVSKSHVPIANTHARLNSHVVKTTPMKRGHCKIMQPHKWRTQTEVHAAHKGVLPIIKQDDSKKETLVESLRD